jgi:hypothetical protein
MPSEQEPIPDPAPGGADPSSNSLTHQAPSIQPWFFSLLDRLLSILERSLVDPNPWPWVKLLVTIAVLSVLLWILRIPAPELLR